MVRRINPRIVRVTTTSIRVNPVVEKTLLREAGKPFLNLPVIILLRSISYLNYRVNPVVEGSPLPSKNHPFPSLAFALFL